MCIEECVNIQVRMKLVKVCLACHRMVVGMDLMLVHHVTVARMDLTCMVAGMDLTLVHCVTMDPYVHTPMNSHAPKPCV